MSACWTPGTDHLCLHIPELPLVYILAMSSPPSPSFLHTTYSRSTLALLSIHKFSAPLNVELIDELVEKTFCDPNFEPAVMLGPGSLGFLADFVSRHTASVDATLTIIQLALMKHFTEPLTIFIESSTLGLRNERLAGQKLDQPDGAVSNGKGKGRARAHIPMEVDEADEDAGRSEEEESELGEDEDEEAAEAWRIEVRVRFIRALHELDYLGVVKPTGRKADHVVRTLSVETGRGVVGARSALALIRLALAAVGGQDQPVIYSSLMGRYRQRSWGRRWSEGKVVSIASRETEATTTDHEHGEESCSHVSGPISVRRVKKIF
ncbi:predicted protein [Postia placenta Mad-698-R]|nr:predicted protein [Postia placenta Mad-698-R]